MYTHMLVLLRTTKRIMKIQPGKHLGQGTSIEYYLLFRSAYWLNNKSIYYTERNNKYLLIVPVYTRIDDIYVFNTKCTYLSGLILVQCSVTLGVLI